MPEFDPAFDEELAAEIEILVLLRGAQPRGISGAFVDDDGAVVHVEGRLRTVLHAPAVERLAVEEGGEAGSLGPFPAAWHTGAARRRRRRENCVDSCQHFLDHGAAEVRQFFISSVV